MALDRADAAQDEQVLAQVAQRLGTSGYPLRKEPNLRALAAQRADHMSLVDAMANYLGRPSTALIRQG